MMKNLLSLITVTFFLSCEVFAQNISITASADKNAILIGEPIELTIQAVVPKGKPVKFTMIDSIPHFDIISRPKADSQVTEKGLIIQQKIILTSWDSGRWAIPSFAIEKSRTKPIPVTVSFTSFDPKQPYHDIKEIIAVPKPVESNWWWYLIGAAFFIALFYLFFPQGKKKTETVPVPGQTIYNEAIKSLEKLRAEHISDDKLFYTRLIDIFRIYLQKRKNIQSFSKTTEDLAFQIKQLKLEEDLYHKLVHTLKLSDMVKFAQVQAGTGEKEQSIEVIEKIITAIEHLK